MLREYADCAHKMVDGCINVRDVERLICLGEAVEQTHDVLMIVRDRLEDDQYIGRTEYDSPEVDGEVLIPRSNAVLETGRFYTVKICDATEFDLFGKI